MKELKEFGKRGVALGAVLLMLVSAFAFIGGAHGATVYSLTWEEKNLPSGTNWGVIIWNETGKTATTLTNVSFTPPGSTHVFGNITFSAESGVTYLYNYTGTPWYFNSSRNSVTVSSAGSYEVNFAENFTLNVTETGWSNALPTGYTLKTGWTVPSGQTWEYSIGTSTYSSDLSYGANKLARGTYAVSFPVDAVNLKDGSTWEGAVDAFQPNVSSINITLSANTTLPISFSPLVPVYVTHPAGTGYAPNWDSGLMGAAVQYFPVKGGPKDTNLGFVRAGTTIRANISNTAGYQHLLPVVSNASSQGFYSSGLSTLVTSKNASMWSYQNMTVNVTSPTVVSVSPVADIYYQNMLPGTYLDPPTVSALNSRNLSVWSVPISYTFYRPYIRNYTWVVSYTANGTVQRFSDANVTVNPAWFDAVITLQINFIWGMEPLYVSSVQGNLSSHEWNMTGFISPVNATLLLPPSAIINNGTYDSSGLFLVPQSNGYYNVTLHGNLYAMINRTGYSPVVRYVTAPPGKRLWENFTLSPMRGEGASNSSYWSGKGNQINVGNIPAGYSGLIGNTSLQEGYFITVLNSSREQYRFVFEPYNSNDTYATFNISVTPGAKYLYHVSTNANRNFSLNFSSPRSYYLITWDNWLVDPEITITEYPVAVISAPTAVAYDSAVVLSGSGSYSNITNYTWHIRGPQNFTEYGKTPSVFFSLPGSYSVSLTVTNAAGLTNTSSTSLSVVSSSQDTKIIISAVKSTLGNGTIEYSITVTAKDNVSISSVTVMVGKAYVNVTLTKQTGYEYYYTLYLLPSKYAYGNYTVKITAWNSLDQYNSLTTYLTFGSISQGGLFDYIISHSVLAIMFGIVVVLLIILIFVGEEHFEATHRRRKR